MCIEQITVGQLETNCYLVWQDSDCFLVDPGGDADKIFSYLDSLNLRFILLTHGHFDHILALSEIAKTYPDAQTYVNQNDAYLLENLEEQAKIFGLKASVQNLKFTYIKDGQTIKFGKKKTQVIATPGHTPGSVCYLLDDSLFSGDTLFYNSIGRTDFPGGDMTAMQKSLQKLSQLPENTKVLPGHGLATTIKNEKLYGYLNKY